VVVSSEAGYEKPDPRIFLTALARRGAAPEEAAHVGDRMRADVAGAAAIGVRAVWLDRRGTAGRGGRGGGGWPPEPATVAIRTLTDLSLVLHSA
jgi:putative hydrolase of the HAD superfamily